ncbi:MAG: hypothetical protein A2231_07095 [Candidatus Firestonebacteria bacterium RIFOXYA2_FULL_40_8]|nr:MAG: hypothetical protein A2231_07095 [Candidatus Firestonebacteria bacterium RIFOXYA2_FULL_40_8]
MIKAKLVDTDIRIFELVLALLASLRQKGKGVLVFEDLLRKKAKVSEAIVFGSGNAALLASLVAMKKITKGEKTDVIIPAYTPLALYVTIKQAGLTPVLCDIDAKDFGFSSGCKEAKANGKTLAAIPVRLFGLESSPAGKNDGFFVIEDNAQGFITPLKWDLQLISFNRGKNFPLLNGGAILTNDEVLAEEIRRVRISYSAPTLLNNIVTFAKFKAFCLSKNRLFYNIMLPFIEGMRQIKPPEHISEALLSSWQSMLGAGKIFHCDENMKRRFEIAKKYLLLLKDLDGIDLPEVKEGSIVNRFPLLIKDKNKVEEIQLKLKKMGIESSRMYFKPVHQVYGLESKPGEFKNAEYIAERFLVLPCNPFLSDKEVDFIAEGVKKCFL